MIARHRVSVCPKISIIILHINNIPCLVDCLDSLNKISYPNFQIIIVHNGLRSKPLIDALSQLSPPVVGIIETGVNIGYSGGNNIGIREALNLGTDYILLLNDDTVVAPDFLDVLLETAEKSPDMGILGPRIYYFHEPNKIWYTGARFDPDTCLLTTPGSDQLEDGMNSEPLESDYITGCALLIKRRVIEHIGLLDERFFLYWEDVDWGLRAKKVGLKNIVVPHSHIWHRVSASMGGMDSLLRIYHKTRSHLLLARLHAPESLKGLYMHFFRDMAWLLIKSSDSKRVIKTRVYIAAIRDYHLGRTGKGPDWIWIK